jgi:hypothetical protein
MAAQIDENTLAHFKGTEQHFRHWTSSIIYTDGIEYLNANGAGWLVDAIASHQYNKKVRNEGREGRASAARRSRGAG